MRIEKVTSKKDKRIELSKIKVKPNQLAEARKVKRKKETKNVK